MHGPAFSGPHRRPHARRRCTRPRALKNRLPGHWTPRHWSRRRSCLHGRSRWTYRRFVHRSWPGLGHDHAWRQARYSHGRFRRGRLYSRRSRSLNNGSNRRCTCSRRCRALSRSRGSNCSHRGTNYRAWGHSRRSRWCWRGNDRRSCRRRGCNDPRGRAGGRRCNRRLYNRSNRSLDFNRWGRHCGAHWRRDWSWCSLLLANRVQNIAGAGNMGKIDLGLDFVALSAAGTRRLCRARRLASCCTEMRAHFGGFVLFDRAGMGLFLGDPDFKQHVENRLALDFQLSGQIVNSNLAHPPRFLRTIPLSLHINLTVSL